MWWRVYSCGKDKVMGAVSFVSCAGCRYLASFCGGECYVFWCCVMCLDRYNEEWWISLCAVQYSIYVEASVLCVVYTCCIYAAYLA